tara:strand:+ start:636 stop:1139 length:504 start_codon:yes stop_codon:yes gene_type:complete
MTNYDASTHELDNHKETITNSYDGDIPRIRFWTNPGAPEPTVSTAGSGGLDLFVDDYHVEDNRLKIHTGVYMEIPRGHVGLLLPRSSTGLKGLRLKNTVGVIDSDYRGEILLMADRFDAEEELVDIGKKIAQLIIVPVCPFPMEQVGNFEDLTVTSRSAGGFGSTGE